MFGGLKGIIVYKSPQYTVKYLEKGKLAATLEVKLHITQ